MASSALRVQTSAVWVATKKVQGMRKGAVVRRASWLLLALALLGCDKDDKAKETDAPREYAPHLSEDLVTPLLHGLVVGASDEAAVRAAFASATAHEGRYNDDAATVYVVEVARPDAATLASATEPVLFRADLWVVKGTLMAASTLAATGDRDAICRWGLRTFGDIEKTMKCPGTNRKWGSGKNSGYDYCIGTPDGARALFVSCAATTVDGEVVEGMTWEVAAENLSVSKMGPTQ